MSQRKIDAAEHEHVGFVFQFYDLIPSLTARESVQLVTDIAEEPKSAEEALEIVDLGQRLGKCREGQSSRAQLVGGSALGRTIKTG